MANSLLPAPRNPVTPTLNDLVAAGAFARDVGNAAVVEPVKEIGRGLSDLATGQGVSPDVGAGLFAAMGLLSPRKAGVLTKGIRAYHGSPHKFDQFSMDRIGTGEGAQAYGHGLYFAEAEPVARQYRDKLAGQNINSTARFYLQRASGDKDRALAALDADFARSSMPDKNVQDNIRRQIESGSGHMYEVNIRANPEQFLDWDRPLSGQGQVGQVLVEKARVKPEHTARQGYEILADEIGRRQSSDMFSGRRGAPNASIALREAGIPGIKYLDQGSRSAGEGSSNYVVFDDKLIDILKRYGIAGMGLSGLVAANQGDFGHQPKAPLNDTVAAAAYQ